MLTTNDIKTSTPTHQDWADARHNRDRLAVEAARQLTAGHHETARKSAAAAMSFDTEMTRIAKELG